MYGPTGQDEFDWRGCSAVQWDREKLSGRANVAGTRMFADSILSNYDDGMTEQDIADSYGTELEHVRTIIRFANGKRLKATA